MTRAIGRRIVFAFCLCASLPQASWARTPAELATLRRAALDQPEDVAAREAYARAALAEGHADEAIDTLKEAVARLPSFRRGYYLIAVAYRAKGAWLEAANYFRICIAVGQQPNDAVYGLGRVLARLGDTAGAIRALRSYIDRERDPAKARYVAEARSELATLTAAERQNALQPPDFKSPSRPVVHPQDRDDLLPPGTPAQSARRSPGPPDADGTLDPFSDPGARGKLRDLQDPFSDVAADETLDPFQGPFGAGPAPGVAISESAREYARAISAYRRALAAHAERVAAAYERGLGLVLNGRSREAESAWNRLDLDDAGVTEARRRIERARGKAR